MKQLGKITSIKEAVFNHRPSVHKWSANYEGIIVTTDQDEIKVGIETGQQCCESSGYVVSEDSFSDFIGSDLLSVDIVNEALKTTEVRDVYEGFTMFVNFNTSKGLFQIAAYNNHNGYYGHNAVIISKELNHSETL